MNLNSLKIYKLETNDAESTIPEAEYHEQKRRSVTFDC